MIIGQVGNGKSTFADKLGKKLQIEVFHLDLYMDNVVGRDRSGKTDKDKVKSYIQEISQKESWIIDGNAFTKDKDIRIKNADVIYLFDSGRIVSFLKYLRRYIVVRVFERKQIGGSHQKLNLKYYIPYIFLKLPRRLKDAIAIATRHNKKIIYIKRFRDVPEI